MKFSSDDIRFTIKKKVLFAFVMGKPAGIKVNIKSLAIGNQLYGKKIGKIELLGYGKVVFKQSDKGVEIQLPKLNKSTDYVLTFKIR
ncbi:MAG: alpha-L-fucosidase C-terminal domain-containing protein [Paludibacter sp.]|nr:alpha-L-fucosidase C-terminal domain-containing protein [Paludibacter sp.]